MTESIGVARRRRRIEHATGERRLIRVIENHRPEQRGTADCGVRAVGRQNPLLEIESGDDIRFALQNARVAQQVRRDGVRPGRYGLRWRVRQIEKMHHTTSEVPFVRRYRPRCSRIRRERGVVIGVFAGEGAVSIQFHQVCVSVHDLLNARGDRLTRHGSGAGVLVLHVVGSRARGEEHQNVRARLLLALGKSVPRVGVGVGVFAAS